MPGSVYYQVGGMYRCCEAFFHELNDSNDCMKLINLTELTCPHCKATFKSKKEKENTIWYVDLLKEESNGNEIP